MKTNVSVLSGQDHSFFVAASASTTKLRLLAALWQLIYWSISGTSRNTIQEQAANDTQGG